MLSPRPKPRAKAGAEASISAPSEAAAVSATALFLNLVMSLPPRAGARLRRSLHHSARSRRAVEHAERVLRSGRPCTITGQARAKQWVTVILEASAARRLGLCRNKGLVPFSVSGGPGDGSRPRPKTTRAEQKHSAEEMRGSE